MGGKLARFAVIVGAAGASVYAFTRLGRAKGTTLQGRSRRVNHKALGAAITTCSAGPKHAISVCVTRPDKLGPQLKDDRGACQLLKSSVDKDRESFYAVLLNAQNRVIGIEEVHKGTLTHVDVHPREVFKAAVLVNANAIVVAHNHPSGSPKASESDRDLTKRLRKVGDEIGIPVLDSLVVTSSGCTSVS